MKVMAAAVGVERTEQAALADHLAQGLKGRGRSLLFNEDHRVDLARGVVHGDDQVHRGPALDAHVPRPVLMQHHAAHRPARPLLAVRRALGRRSDQRGPVQAKLRHGVAKRVIVALGQLLVEMPDREVGVLVPVEPEHPLDLLFRRTPRRRRATPIDQPSLAVRLVALSPSLERANAHPQQLRRRLLCHLSKVPAVQNRSKTASSVFPRECAPCHQGPPGPPKNTTLHELRNHVTPSASDSKKS